MSKRKANNIPISSPESNERYKKPKLNLKETAKMGGAVVLASAVAFLGGKASENINTKEKVKSQPVAQLIFEGEKGSVTRAVGKNGRVSTVVAPETSPILIDLYNDKKEGLIARRHGVGNRVSFDLHIPLPGQKEDDVHDKSATISSFPDPIENMGFNSHDQIVAMTSPTGPKKIEIARGEDGNLQAAIAESGNPVALDLHVPLPEGTDSSKR